jgi:glycosyltransferase involved in cell wall biosynthesis
VTSTDLTVIIPTWNAAGVLRDCIASLDAMAPVIVVDGESQDDTREIARSFGARVLVSRERSPARQRNEGIGVAASRWVLCLDADERLTPALRDEIACALSTPGGHGGFAIRRTTWYLGKRIRHSGWREDRVLRLFLRDAGVWRDEALHEGVSLNGTTGVLRHPMEHHSYTTLEDVLEKLERYSTWGAREILRRGRSAGPWDFITRPPARFIKTYFLKRGFLDGTHGAVLAAFSAYGVMLRYAKAWEMRITGANIDSAKRVSE